MVEVLPAVSWAAVSWGGVAGHRRIRTCAPPPHMACEGNCISINLQKDGAGGWISHLKILTSFSLINHSSKWGGFPCVWMRPTFPTDLPPKPSRASFEPTEVGPRRENGQRRYRGRFDASSQPYVGTNEVTVAKRSCTETDSDLFTVFFLGFPPRRGRRFLSDSRLPCSFEQGKNNNNGVVFNARHLQLVATWHSNGGGRAGGETDRQTDRQRQRELAWSPCLRMMKVPSGYPLYAIPVDAIVLAEPMEIQEQRRDQGSTLYQ